MKQLEKRRIQVDFELIPQLSCVIYIFAIALTQLSEDTALGRAYFPTLADGMFSLLFHGCFYQGASTRRRHFEAVSHGFYMFFTCFHMVFTWFYVVFTWFLPTFRVVSAPLLDS